MTKHEQTQAIAVLLLRLPFWVRVSFKGILDAMEYVGTDRREEEARSQFLDALAAAGVDTNA